MISFPQALLAAKRAATNDALNAHRRDQDHAQPPLQGLGRPFAAAPEAGQRPMPAPLSRPRPGARHCRHVLLHFCRDSESLSAPPSHRSPASSPSLLGSRWQPAHNPPGCAHCPAPPITQDTNRSQLLMRARNSLRPRPICGQKQEVSRARVAAWACGAVGAAWACGAVGALRPISRD